MTEDQVTTASGTWQNPRLEFRLLNQHFSPGSIPYRTPVNPSLIEDETILAHCFLEIFTEITCKWLHHKQAIVLEDLLFQSLVLFAKLDKQTKKEISSQFLTHLERLANGPLKGWIRIEQFKKKAHSEPVVRICFDSLPTDKNEVLKQLRKQNLALHFLKTQSLQTSYYETDIKSL